VIDKFNRLGSDDQQDLLNSSARASSTGRLAGRGRGWPRLASPAV